MERKCHQTNYLHYCNLHIYLPSQIHSVHFQITVQRIFTHLLINLTRMSLGRQLTARSPDFPCPLLLCQFSQLLCCVLCCCVALFLSQNEMEPLASSPHPRELPLCGVCDRRKKSLNRTARNEIKTYLALKFRRVVRVGRVVSSQTNRITMATLYDYFP